MALQSACDLPTKTEDGKIGPIVFNDLQVGQTSSYTSFAISRRLEPTFKYTYDSLIVTVTAGYGDAYRVMERFVDTDTTDWWIGNDTLTYLLQVSMDTLTYQKMNSSDPYSRIFSWLWFGPPDLPLAPVTEVEVTLDGWRPVFSPGECCLGTLDSLEILGQSYGPVSVKLIDETPVDGPAVWWLYSGTDGMVRHMFLDAWTGTGKGWDLLP